MHFVEVEMYKRPEIETKMYFVQEHLYYIQNYVAPVKGYCVCEAVVRGFYQLGYTKI